MRRPKQTCDDVSLLGVTCCPVTVNQIFVAETPKHPPRQMVQDLQQQRGQMLHKLIVRL